MAEGRSGKEKKKEKKKGKDNCQILTGRSRDRTPNESSRNTAKEEHQEKMHCNLEQLTIT